MLPALPSRLTLTRTGKIARYPGRHGRESQSRQTVLQVGVSPGLRLDPTGIFALLTGRVAMTVTVSRSLYLRRSVTVSGVALCVRVCMRACVRACVFTSVVVTTRRSVLLLNNYSSFCA